MKIYDFAAFPNPARVRIALHEKNAFDKVNFVQVDVPAGEHRREEFRKINPGLTVPVLELEDGTCISECTAITEYIDGVFEGITLTGQSPRERAMVHMMQRRAETYVMDAVGSYFHQATPGLGPDIEGDQCAEWGHRQKAVADDGMAYFDNLLSTQPYVAGDNFSMADITLFMGLGFADFAQINIPDRFSHLANWRLRIAERDSVKAVLG